MSKSKSQITIKNGIKELGIFAKERDALVSSLVVADIFDKDHKNVLRDIRTIITNLEELKKDDQDLGLLKFVQSYYKNSQNKKQPCFNMDRIAFTILAMGFAGKEALKFKLMYTKAFNEMEKIIATRGYTKEGNKLMASTIKKYIGDNSYSPENDLINRAVLGISSSTFREMMNLKPSEAIRDHLEDSILENLDKAQEFNSNLIIAGKDYAERKDTIEQRFKNVKKVTIIPKPSRMDLNNKEELI